MFLYAPAPPLHCSNAGEDYHLVYELVTVGASWRRTHSTRLYHAKSHARLHMCELLAYPGLFSNNIDAKSIENKAIALATLYEAQALGQRNV